MNLSHIVIGGFAAFTGVLLWLSSIGAGWLENWAVYRRLPEAIAEHRIKRIIGVPGDTISIQNGVLTVNGVAVDEPYINAPPVYNGTWQVSEGELFVLGDNRNDSRDSHQWGLLPIGNVIGRAVLIYWPPEELQVIRHINELYMQQAATVESWSMR